MDSATTHKFNKRYKDDKKYKVSIKNVMFDNLVLSSLILIQLLIAL